MDKFKDAIDIIKSFEKEYNKLVKEKEKLDLKIFSLHNDLQIEKLLHKKTKDNHNIIEKHQNKKINEQQKLIEKYETKHNHYLEQENKILRQLLKDNNISISPNIYIRHQ